MNAVNSDNVDKLFTLLSEVIKKSRIKKAVNMAKYTSFKAGGNAAILVTPKNEEELSLVMKVISSEDVENFILGNGTNVLVRDGGYDGIIVRMGPDMSQIQRQGEGLLVQSGALLTAVAKQALYYSLGGFEFACGIPGSMGGGTAMNAGAYGGELKDIISKAKVMNKKGEIFSVQKSEMNFGYRSSVFQEKGYIVLNTEIQLAIEEKNVIRDRMKAFTKKRNEKQPVTLPSAGSFFKRPEGNYAGKLIEEASLKGLTLGGAQVSELHSNFIVNVGDATATDIINLMALVQTTVMDQSGVLLEPEVKIIGKL